MLKSSTYYHGSTHRIEKFMDDFVGGKDANDQEGPGIYFTSDIDDALAIGHLIYEVELKPRALMTKEVVNVNKAVSRAILVKLAKAAPDWRTHAENWSENPRQGILDCIEAALSSNESVADVFQQMCVEFYRNEPVDYVRNVVKLTEYDGTVKDFPDGTQHVIVLNPQIIHLKKVHDMQQTNEIRSLIRSIVSEVSAMDMAMHQTGAPAVAQGRTVDIEGLVAFMRQKGVNGNENDIISILEGQPTDKVKNDMVEVIEFYQTGADPQQLDAETMLDYYLKWNKLNIDKNEILAFSISEQ